MVGKISHCTTSSRLIREARHRLQLEEVLLVESVDSQLDRSILTDTGPNITIQSVISEAKIVLIGFTAQTVTRYLVDKLSGQTEFSTDRLDLGNGQISQRSEVANGVSPSRRISNSILG